MAVNKYVPHVYVLPEDDANRQIAIGFEKDSRIQSRLIQVVAPAGGWLKTLEKLRNDYFPMLERNQLSQVLILIDCDHEPERIVNALDEVPQHLKDRVFMLGTLREPESLKVAMNTTFEGLGEQIANACFEEEPNVWKHPELAHNKEEVARLKKSLFEAVFQL